MVEQYLDPSSSSVSNGTSGVSGSVSGDVLPEDRFASESTEGPDWVKFDKPILYF